MTRCDHPSCHAPATDERGGWVWCRAHLFWALQAEEPRGPVFMSQWENRP